MNSPQDTAKQLHLIFYVISAYNTDNKTSYSYFCFEVFQIIIESFKFVLKKQWQIKNEEVGTQPGPNRKQFQEDNNQIYKFGRRNLDHDMWESDMEQSVDELVERHQS